MIWAEQLEKIDMKTSCQFRITPEKDTCGIIKIVC